MEKSILVVGHSHIGAVRHAAIRRRSSGGKPYMVRTINVLDPRFGQTNDLKLDAHTIAPMLLAEIRRVIDKRQPMVFTMLGGNAHTMMSLVKLDDPWDFNLTEEKSPPLNPVVRTIPEADVREMLRTIMTDELGGLTHLRRELGPIWQIESPPPVASEEFIRDHIEPYFLNKPEYHKNGVAPIGLRYRAWRLSCRIFREHCESIGCGYVSLPSTIFDDIGCIKQCLAVNATHGNIEFGQRLIEELDGLVAAT